MSRRPYVRPISAREWIFRHPRYVRYMMREFSCLFIAGWTLLMVWGLKQLADGPAAWAAFLELVKTPASVAFHGVTLAFAAYHSVTWFNLTPKALPLQVGERFVPDWVIAGVHYAAWAALSLIILVWTL
ncbi:MAG: fumarate reductase subunit [Burkholderiales bacterium]|jgi:fumarate reductase subunit C|nr:fumarate reductase subunit [Burkholderiales bacterium]